MPNWYLTKKKVLFHHENTLAHTSAIATTKIVELSYEYPPHTPYSSELGLGNFSLLQNMKKSLARQKFDSTE